METKSTNMFYLTKKFRFEAAHRLAKGYDGKCANIHGHSWNGEIELKCETLDDYDFGIDFGVIKKIISPLIDDLDHSILVHESDTDLIAMCKEKKWKVHSFTANPTSEFLAYWLFHEWSLKLDGILRLSHRIIINSVIIEETCTSRCKYMML